MNIEWCDDLKIGIEQLDEDHRNIIDLYNKIDRHRNSGDDDVLVERAITDFKFIFTLHFLKEENLMIEVNYPDFETHAREHETMITILEAFSHGRRGGPDLGHNIAFLVLQWISSHLEGADRRLAAFVRMRNQLKATPRATDE